MDAGISMHAESAAQGPSAPALHRLDAARHAAGAGRQARRAAARALTRRGDPPRAAGHRRARLVPVPAAVRHGAVVRARRARTCGGWCGRRPRTTRGGLAAGWRSRSTRPRTRRARRADPGAGDHPGRGADGLRGHRHRHRVVVAANRMKHPLDARTLARLAVRYAGPRASSASGSPTTSGGAAPRTSTAPSRSPGRGGLARVPHGGELLGRTHVAGLPGRAAAPAGSGHGVRAAEDPRAAGAGRATAGVTLRGLPGLATCARRLRRAGGRAAADAVRRRRAGGARAPTTRCCSAPGWRRSTSWPAHGAAGWATTSWRSWPAARCAARGRRRRCARRCWRTSTAGWRLRSAPDPPTSSAASGLRPAAARAQSWCRPGPAR